jgi:copper chaperone CopZ
VPSAKVQGKINKGDVGDLAKAAAAAKTPHRAKGAPSVTLVLPASDLKKGDAKKVSAALKKVKGVNAKATHTSIADKEIHVKLDDKGGAKLADIKKALGDYTKE